MGRPFDWSGLTWAVGQSPTLFIVALHTCPRIGSTGKTLMQQPNAASCGKRGTASAGPYSHSVRRIHRRIEDDLIAWLEAGTYLHLGPVVRFQIQPANFQFAVRDHASIQPVIVEDHRLRGDQHDRVRATHLQVDNAMQSRSQYRVLVVDIDFGEQRAGATG